MLGKAPVFVSGPLRGEAQVPGDKSISHRALIAGAKTGRPLRIRNLNPGRDVRATRYALEALGAHVVTDGPALVVHGPLRATSGEPPLLDCMNSGSTARMLLGVCAGANVPARFDGDASLRRRPMEPVAAQLRAFGAKIETTEGRLPMAIFGTTEIQTRDFILIEPSAQVKSALLFAGYYAGVAVTIRGDRGTRDHTERLLRYLDTASGEIEVPADFSSAAFFITAATIAPGSELLLRNVGVNPTRTGLLDALAQMGARIELRDRRELCGEPVADIAVTSAPLSATAIAGEMTLRAIDEVPLIAVAAACARGVTSISGIRPLRTKESDRVAAIERLLASAGITVETEPNALRVAGGDPRGTGAMVDTHHDHRTAMAAAVLACAAGPIGIDSDASIDVSFPDFLPTLERVRR